MRTAIFDIETAPNSRLLDLALRSAQERAAKRGEAPEVDAETVKAEMALSPVFGRVVAVGVLDADTEEPLIFTGDDEPELLELFWHNVEGSDLFISWNGLAFDLPWLYVRSMIHSVPPTVRVSMARYRLPGETNHVDLFALLTDWRGNRFRHLRLDLATVARALGVEPPVGDGAQIPRLYEKGDWDAIKRHLESDLLVTLAIWQRLGCPGLPAEVAASVEVPF